MRIELHNVVLDATVARHRLQIAQPRSSPASRVMCAPRVGIASTYISPIIGPLRSPRGDIAARYRTQCNRLLPTAV